MLYAMTLSENKIITRIQLFWLYYLIRKRARSEWNIYSVECLLIAWNMFGWWIFCLLHISIGSKTIFKQNSRSQNLIFYLVNNLTYLQCLQSTWQLLKKPIKDTTARNISWLHVINDSPKTFFEIFYDNSHKHHTINSIKQSHPCYVCIHQSNSLEKVKKLSITTFFPNISCHSF